MPLCSKRWFARRLLAVLLLCGAPGLALPADPPAVPAPFEQLVPATLGDGLALVEVRKRCDNCEPWRLVDFRSNDSATPVWREKVSVRAGVTAMYAYPGTGYFANVKLEQSMPGMYEQDKAVVIRALDHDFRHLKARVVSYLESNPAAREKVASLLPPGKEVMESERHTLQGVHYASYTLNVLGLSGGTISQIHFFVPGRDLIVTAYLLQQKNAKFTTIAEFLRLRAAFIQSWTGLLAASAPVGASAGDHAGGQQRQGGGLEGARPAALP
ncbi:MAG: hypothetical protein ACREWI_05610 [Telluria sp.]